jgi:osmotically-inducible protein OsmY
MANEYDYDYERSRYGRGYYDEPYSRGYGRSSDEPYYRGYGRGSEESYSRGYGRSSDEPYYRGYGRGSEESYSRGYGRSSDQQYYRSSGYYDEPYYGGSSYGSYYNEPYRSRQYGTGYGSYYNEPYGSYDYGRYEYGDRSREPYYRRGEEGRYRESYERGRYGRGADRGFFERVGDELRSWFGDEEAERRRQMDARRSESHSGRGPRGYQRSDERIREDVNDRLTDDWRVDASDIEVTVSSGVVTLSGRVDNRDDKRRAEEIAEDVKGVKDVTNQLRIGQSEYSTTGGITTGTTTGTETGGVTRTRTART